MGRLEVVVGPMYSGKSEELLRRLRRAEIGGNTVVVVKPDIDSRYSKKHVVSHAGTKMPAMILRDSAEIRLQTLGYDVVGIDEIQFFDDVDLVNNLEIMAKRQVIIASGLDMTYRGEPFGQVPTLLAVADSILKLSAVCHSCGKDATMTQRLIDGKPAPATGPTVQVGGLDSYEARCRGCWRV